MSIFEYFLVFLIFNSFLFMIVRYIDQVQKESKRVLEFQANHDQLTALPNRYYLEMCFPLWQERIGDRYSVFYLDMDNFKIINDRYGHSVGDAILVELARRLQSSCPEDTIVVRQGGDEFIMLAPYCDIKKLHQFAEIIISQLNKTIRIESLEFSLSGSIGVAISDRHNHALGELLQKADLAMYEAKRARSGFAFFSDKLQQISNERAFIEGALRNAMTNNQMYMVYQPQIHAESGLVVGVEALIRWIHPLRGMVPPDRFIPVAESSGQINAIGDFVIDTSFREISEIHSSYRSLRISVNVSVRQLLNEQFQSYLNSKSTEYGISPTNIVIEITESLFIEDLEQIYNLLMQIRNNGYNISLDDFGTGYSSLNVLRKLPINEIKVDKSFVHDILIDSQDNALIRSIIGIGRSLNIPTLAEGVEELEQVLSLKTYGCELFQGYFFAKPMNIENLKNYLIHFTPYEYQTSQEIVDD
ncbi:MAG: EAL domain-containing protein [Candidatus Thiodiazotropha sp. (ex Lucinoma borealis)]|nr:EAL domain-containing protein [Candidatus Thiodiazotropha sp. (ex Lucinoma borealis)]